MACNAIPQRTVVRPVPKPRPRKLQRPPELAVSSATQSSSSSSNDTKNASVAAAGRSLLASRVLAVEHLITASNRTTSTAPIKSPSPAPRNLAVHGVTVDNEAQIHGGAPRVIHAIRTRGCVCGLTTLDGELYVLYNGRDEEQVEVYNTSTYELLRPVTVPGLQKNDAQDMAASQRNNCLFVADSGKTCIHKLSTDGSVSKWKVPGEPCGLSVTPDGSLLVLCRGETDRLMMLSVDAGKLRMRQIKLHSYITGACQAVELTDGQLVVCQHGQPGLCALDNDGKVTQTYCGGAETRLKSPCHVTVDRRSHFLFVADHDNHRIVLVSESLLFVSDVIRVSMPSRLYLDHVTGRLYVGHGCGVTVVQP